MLASFSTERTRVWSDMKTVFTIQAPGLHKCLERVTLVFSVRPFKVQIVMTENSTEKSP